MANPRRGEATLGGPGAASVSHSCSQIRPRPLHWPQVTGAPEPSICPISIPIPARRHPFLQEVLMTAPRFTGSERRRAPAAGPLAPRRLRRSVAVQPLHRSAAEPLERRTLLATFTVTTTADAGPG